MTQRNVADTIGWYQDHEVYPSSLSFDPDGMCQKICRTARNIGPGAASALASALMTPEEFRVHDVAKMQRGMVLYFDNKFDDNPWGHVVTILNEAPSGNLADLLVRTNSVKSNQIVVVRGDYFGRYWNDPVMFAGKWLNGEELILNDRAPVKPKPKKRPHMIDRLQKMDEEYGRMMKNHQGEPRVLQALSRDRQQIRNTIERFK